MSPLRVVVDATAVRLGGGLSYVTRQLAGVERVRPDVDLYVVGARWNLEALDAALRSEVVRAPVRGLATRLLYEQYNLPGRLRGAVLHCPANLAPLWPGDARTVLTVQNPNFFGRGRTFPHNRAWHRRLRIAASQRSVRAATTVVAVSEAMMAEIRADQPDLGDRGVVIQSGAPEWTDEERRPAGIAVDELGYVLSLANDAGHKRFDDLVAAWAQAFAEDPEPAALLFVGAVTEARQRTLLEHVPVERRDQVVFTGPVSDQAELRWLVAHALVLAAPSALEAHPHTPAEAGALGCPLVLSDIPPHREVAGDHPVAYVPVGDVDALAGALRQAAADPARRPWTWPITWDDHARRLVEVWEQTRQA